MKKNIRINNIPFENYIVSEEGDNIIYATNCEEVFFGIYSIKIGNTDILCESNSPNKVYCEIIIDGRVYENIPFKIVKSEKTRIILNKNTIDKNIMNEKTFQHEILKLKKDLVNVSKQKILLNESVESNYKQELLSEFFKVVSENENFIEHKISLLGSELTSKLHDTLEETVNKSIVYFNNKNAELLRDNINETYSEISVQNKKNIEELTDSLKRDLLKAQQEQNSKISKELSIFSEELSNVKENAIDIVFEGVEKSKKKLIDSIELSLKKHKEEITLNSEINQKILEDLNSSKKEMEIIFNEQLKNSENLILESFDREKKELSNTFVSEFERAIKQKEEELNSKTENIIEYHAKNMISFLENKKKDIEDLTSNIITEANNKIKDLEKKVNDLSSQLNKSNGEKKRINDLLQESKNYTDKKMNHILEESKRFTRVMMDMVGGGSGSVAVQYAAGGTINGDLNVSGSLNSGEFSTTGSILSGEINITEIFSGEGAGDNNVLDGGTM